MHDANAMKAGPLRNPYYEDDLCTIYHGDALEIMAGLAPEFDLVFTSPPYNKGLRIDGRWQGRVTASSKGSRFRGGYGTHNDMMPMPEYEAWQQECLQAMWELTNPGGAVFYNHKPRILNGRLWTPLTLAGDLPLRQIITWNVGVGINVMPTALAPAYEWILVFARPSWHIDMRQSARGDVWTMAPAKNSAHPAPFPVGLPARALDMTQAGIVLDPFMGSGTTLVAAKAAGRRVVGIEIEERYCEMAASRLAQEAFAV